MAQKTAVLSKSFKSIFLLEKSKLSRLLNIIEDKYKDAGKNPNSVYNITLKNGKKIVVHDIEHILAHDNAIKNPIVNFAIKYKYSRDDDINECEIIYDKTKSKIDFSIESSSVRFSNELFAEIEEQIERSIVKSWIYAIKKDLLSNIMLLFMLITIISFIIAGLYKEPNQYSKDTDFLSDSNVQHLLNFSKNAQKNDDKLDMLYNYYLIRLVNMTKKDKPFSFNDFIYKVDYKIILILLPFIIIIISFGYLIIYCYPGSIFLWGDYEDYYNSILNKRKIVINAIVITLLIGIIGNLSVYAFSKVFS